MKAILRRATKHDYTIVKNLVPYYIYEMSGPMGWDPNAEGRYDGCDDLMTYWQEPEHYPYLISAEGSLAGFAMVRPYPGGPDRTEVGEFFIVRKFQRRGVGAESAFWLFDAHPGAWLIRVLDHNTVARRFWDRTISQYTGGDFSVAAEEYSCPNSGTWPMQFYRFSTRSQPPVPPDAKGRGALAAGEP